MIIVQLSGGLGNQMFQYALFLQLKNLGKTVKIDDATGFAEDEQRDFALAPFGVRYERPTREELIQMLDSSVFFWSRVRRKILGRKRKAYFEEDKRYHPEIMTWDDIYLEGYWQTEKYFAASADLVRQTYDTDKLLAYVAAERPAEGLEAYLARMESGESVSVHIRRGDYLLPAGQKLYGGICTAAYYREAMRRMKRERPDCRFYLFTNDKAWIRERLAQETAVMDGAVNAEDRALAESLEIVELGGNGSNDYAEFALMSRCRHNILANSSFSWWASYLNRNADKIVLAPDRWLNGWDCEDIYRQDMRRVKG